MEEISQTHYEGSMDHHVVLGEPYSVTLRNGTIIWFLNETWHRSDGPAVIHLNKPADWYLNGKQLSFKDWCNKLNLSFDDIIELKLMYG